METNVVACRLALLGLVAAGLALASSARAQDPVFPADPDFVPVRCGGADATDPIGDRAGANGSRDVVGEAGAPALLYAVDATHLFVRLRVDGDPTRPGGELDPFGWGFVLDTDDDLTTYELLGLVDGIANPEVVLLAANETTATPGDPGDRPETTLATLPAETFASATPAGTSLGGDEDWFVTIALSLEALTDAGAPLGLRVAWAGTSTSAAALDGDLACHDASLGAPVLDAIPMEPLSLGAVAPIGDRDADGIDDAVECPSPPACPDSDGDGLDDLDDPDDDEDGIPTLEERPGGLDEDTDDDGTPDHLDTDDDDDGAPTRLERPGPADTDTDGDGTPDHLDTDDDDDGLPTRAERPAGFDVDTDGDGAPDRVDDDDDADGIVTRVEADDEAALGLDVDRDGRPAWHDDDSDGDGLSDAVEGRTDADGDGVPDYLDPRDPRTGDLDGDGLRDEEECPRLCPDNDRDGVADVRDADDDGDGVLTRDELYRDLRTGALRPRDTDADGVPDHLDADDDGDGLLTYDERAGDLDRDTDLDGVPDHLDADDDGDTIPTLDERADGAALAPPARDADGDGFPDSLDADADGDGRGDEEEGREDADGDGIPDYLDPTDGVRGYTGGALCGAAPGARGPGSAGAPFLALLGLALLAVASRRRGARARLRSRGDVQ